MCHKVLPFAAAIVLSCPAVYAQVSHHARTVLAESIDESKTVTLHRNTHPQANSANDRGRVADQFHIRHMYLQLKRAPESQQALDRFVSELQNPKSPDYHHWLTAQQFGEKFGLAQQDLDAVTGWLDAHGFTVHSVYPNLVIDFSGTARQVREAFHTPIHHLSVAGEAHISNLSDPKIPAALLPVVAGIASLNDFMPHPLSHPVANFTISASRQAMVPSDLATIYNLKPAFGAGVSAEGQRIVVVENSDLYSSGDWLVFRKVFGLARPYPHGTLLTTHPASSNGAACTDPGVNENGAEAIVDAEWATAAAPNATIEVASCSDGLMFGGFIALQNLLTSGTPPAVVSISYGMAEADLGEATNAYISSLYQMAVADGVSIFVSSGDSGAAFGDKGASLATRGVAVNGYASTPYNVAVGATDFADTYFGTVNDYWSSTNSPAYGSALSYIPEIPWNASCASKLLATSNGFATTYGVNGYCNSGVPPSIAASGGGPSGCATGSPFGPSGSTCAGYAKPTWQSVVGNPSDGVRDIPDLAVFASNNIWGHASVACYSDTSNGGTSCLDTPDNWNRFGGTSISAPIMAGIQALVNQKTGSRWGNPNPVYYRLASIDYGSEGNSSCNSTGAAAGSPCVFHDITLGDIDVVCGGTNDCFFGDDASGYGVLSTSTTSFLPAFAAGIGWDFATGLGSVDVWNLLNNWSNGVQSSAATDGTVSGPQNF